MTTPECQTAVSDFLTALPAGQREAWTAVTDADGVVHLEHDGLVEAPTEVANGLLFVDVDARGVCQTVTFVEGRPVIRRHASAYECAHAVSEALGPLGSAA